ncbi:MAG TPA: methylated-DNA--[protein]-cysteine S-methyltransferase [Armatimonadota bacterium]|nr:methylated-DNA--[protein]-cysteine S-methyltransferase [Armatimonadota bacterium]
MHLFFYQTSIGPIGIAETDGRITNLYFGSTVTLGDAECRETALLQEAARQVNAYLAGELREFSLPLAPSGTAFMQAVWQKLCEIPYGKTASYQDIAIAIGNPKAVRAVGQANHRNPIPIIIPCHRVIGSDGKLTGYGGGLELKKKLLQIEGYTTFAE